MIISEITQRAGEQQPVKVIQTVSCDRLGCTSTVTFDALNPEGRKNAESESPWMKDIRTVKRVGDQKEFLYCSDECEVLNAGDGVHKAPVLPPQVIAHGDQASIRAAAERAKALKEGDKALRDGKLKLVE